MEENRKGTGVFYAVVGVATLVVAIIGATFAYFSASATNNTVITGETAEATNLGLEVKKLDTATGGLIPMYDNLADKGVKNDCVDSNGNTVCHVYEIKLTNGKSPVNINGSLTFTSTTQNIVYDITVSNAAEASTLDALSTEIGAATTGVAFGTPGTLANSVAFTANEVKYYYVTVWLHDIGDSQEKVDAGQKSAYTGTVTFNAVGANGTNGVTATFSEGA
ncbi:MAG: hypothetical protein SO167_00140 [Bacilli bacterium]|nr:hypothetical protein [Bacilli bacterium]